MFPESGQRFMLREVEGYKSRGIVVWEGISEGLITEEGLEGLE